MFEFLRPDKTQDIIGLPIYAESDLANCALY